MKRLLKTYLPFTRGVIQAFAAYRMNFYVWILGDMFQTMVLLYIWYAIFQSSTQSVIQGFTFREMTGYVVMSTVTGMLINNDVHWAIGEDVRTGNIAMNLIKPVSYQLRQYFASIGGLVANFLFIFLPLWTAYSAYNYFALGVLPSPLRIAVYFLSAFLSSLILFYINYIFGLAAFFVEYVFGFVFAKEAVVRLLSGSLIPLTFFPQAFRSVFAFLPFAGLIFTPVMVYLGKYTGLELLKNIGVQAVWVLILAGLTQLVWKSAIRRLTILGG